MKSRSRPDEANAKKIQVEVHPAWKGFIEYCEKLKFGELDKLQIHDGVPVSAEHVKEKVRFN